MSQTGGQSDRLLDTVAVNVTLQSEGKAVSTCVGAWEWNVLTDEVWRSQEVFEILGVAHNCCLPALEGLLVQVHEEDRTRVSDTICRAFEKKRSYDVLYRIVSGEGTLRWIENRAGIRLDEHGQVARYVGTMTDVTAREEEARSLLREKQQLRDLIEALPAAIYATDSEGRITLYNQAAVDLAGNRPEIGSDKWCVSWRLYWPDGTPLPHDECPMAVALNEKRPVRGAEAVAERPDGARVPFMPLPTPLYDNSGEMVGAVNLLVDISDRKAAEQTVMELNRRLQQAMTETHHRVKNNLQVIAAMVEIMGSEGDAIPAERVRALGSRIHALAVVHDMLTHHSKKDGDPENLSTRELFAKVIPLLQHSTGGHTIHSEVADIALPVRRAISLALLLNELVQNAIKHGNNRIDVAFTVKEGAAELRVTDDGPGFPAGFAPHALESTGLELVTTLTEHDLSGAVVFRNNDGGSAEVTVTIPIAPKSES